MTANTPSLISEYGELKLRRLLEHLPKIELHQHLEGSFSIDLLLRVHDKISLKLPSRDRETLKQLYQAGSNCSSLLEFLQVFKPLSELFLSAEVVHALTLAVLAEAEEQNISLLELRYSPLYMSEFRDIPLPELMDAVLSAIEQFQKSSNMAIGSILIVERQRPVEESYQIIELARNFRARGVVGLDLANDEMNFPPELFTEVFNSFSELPTTIHAGEAGGPESIEAAVQLLGAKRIGHGISAQRSDSLMQNLARQGILIECCPTSNIQTGAVQGMSKHPIPQFLERQIPISICTDDPGVCNTNLCQELLTVCCSFQLSAINLRQIYQDALRYSFLDLSSLEPKSKAILNTLNEKLF